MWLAKPPAALVSVHFSDTLSLCKVLDSPEFCGTLRRLPWSRQGRGWPKHTVTFCGRGRHMIDHKMQNREKHEWTASLTKYITSPGIKVKQACFTYKIEKDHL